MSSADVVWSYQYNFAVMGVCVVFWKVGAPYRPTRTLCHRLCTLDTFPGTHIGCALRRVLAGPAFRQAGSSTFLRARYEMPGTEVA